jgi:hypothetical protein
MTVDFTCYKMEIWRTEEALMISGPRIELKVSPYIVWSVIHYWMAVVFTCYKMEIWRTEEALMISGPRIELRVSPYVVWSVIHCAPSRWSAGIQADRRRLVTMVSGWQAIEIEPEWPRR